MRQRLCTDTFSYTWYAMVDLNVGMKTVPYYYTSNAALAENLAITYKCRLCDDDIRKNNDNKGKTKTKSLTVTNNNSNNNSNKNNKDNNTGAGKVIILYSA